MFKKKFAAFFIFATMQLHAAQPSLDEIIVKRVKVIVIAERYQEHVTLSFQNMKLDYIMTYGLTIEERKRAIAVGKNAFLRLYPTITPK